MATGGHASLSDDLIEKLAEVIVVTKMETIVISYLKIQSETVANHKTVHQGNPTAFNRNLLTLWKYMNPAMDQAQVSPISKTAKESEHYFTILETCILFGNSIYTEYQN